MKCPSLGASGSSLGTANYIGELVQALWATKALIAPVGLPTQQPCDQHDCSLQTPPEGEYEAPGLEDAPQEELLTPHQLVPKGAAVRSSGAYLTRVLGCYAATCRMEDFCQGVIVFSSFLTYLLYPGQLMK